MRILSSVLVIVALTGCWNQQKLERSSSWALNADTKIYVAIPPEEIMDVELHSELTALFQRYYPNTRAAIHRESLNQSFVSAQYSGMDFVVYPRIGSRITPNGLDQFIKGDIQLGEVNRGELDMDLLIFTAREERLVDRLQVKTRTSLFSSETSSLLLEPVEEYLRETSR